MKLIPLVRNQFRNAHPSRRALTIRYAVVAMAVATLPPCNVQAQDRDEPVLANGARVQVVFGPRVTQQAPHLAGRWHTGRVGGQRCIFVAPDSVTVHDLYQLGPFIPGPVPQLAVPIEDILRLRVSTKYDGRFAPRAAEPGVRSRGQP